LCVYTHTLRCIWCTIVCVYARVYVYVRASARIYTAAQHFLCAFSIRRKKCVCSQMLFNYTLTIQHVTCDTYEWAVTIIWMCRVNYSFIAVCVAVCVAVCIAYEVTSHHNLKIHAHDLALIDHSAWYVCCSVFCSVRCSVRCSVCCSVCCRVCSSVWCSAYCSVCCSGSCRVAAEPAQQCYNDT